MMMTKQKVGFVGITSLFFLFLNHISGPTLVTATSVHTSETIQTTSPAMQLPNLSIKPHGNSDPSSVQQVEKSDTNNEVRVDCVEEFPDVGVEVCLGDDVQGENADFFFPQTCSLIPHLIFLVEMWRLLL